MKEPVTPSGGRDAPVHRVAVTGMGLVTSLGDDIEQVWDALLARRSGVGYIENFDSRSLPVRIASEVDASKVWLGEAEGKTIPPRSELSRAALFGLSAVQRAWAQSGLAQASLDPTRLGVYLGASSFPSLERDLLLGRGFLDGGRFSVGAMVAIGDRYRGFFAQRGVSNIGAHLAQTVGARGPCVAMNSACSSANHALGEAFNIVRSGRLDAAVAGGTDSMITLFSVVGFTLLGALSRSSEPERASRPFDARRNGFVLGDGAGLVILENMEHALRRGATIHAEMIGYGSSSDGYRFTDVHPEGDGACAAMRGALRSAGLSPSDVDYINAHGTATHQNDRVETLAIHRVFGEHARRLAVSSTKSQLGHLVCAAGGLEFILTALALQRGVLPATINLETRDPECDLDYIADGPRPSSARVALSNSFGFGGQNSCVALRRWEGPGAAGERG